MIRWFLKRSGRIRAGLAALSLAGACVQSVVAGPAVQGRKTEISIVGDDFHINGAPTYESRFWQGHRIEGLLLDALYSAPSCRISPYTIIISRPIDTSGPADCN